MKLFLVLLFLLVASLGKTNECFPSYFICNSLEFIPGETSIVPFSFPDSNNTSAMPDSIHPSHHKNNKLIAAIFAFPLPFGIFGGHRLYFGTKPYMPFVYIATLGGCFGILPLIDFIAILTSGKENFSRFQNNSRVFMWSK
jgi:TM2 domain-containing membrane protein YozV